MWRNKNNTTNRMLSQFRIPNPRYPNSPAHMSDGRLFTDYRPAGHSLGAPNFELKQRLQQTGESLAKTDRSLIVMSAGRTGCVDTMVPESSKRLCRWNECVVLPAHELGIGQGRLYLPGSPELARADPDVTAQLSAGPVLHGTFSANPYLYVSDSPDAVARLHSGGGGGSNNRYSAPYGNQSY